jgi:hypothetical protein
MMASYSEWQRNLALGKEQSLKWHCSSLSEDIHVIAEIFVKYLLLLGLLVGLLHLSEDSNAAGESNNPRSRKGTWKQGVIDRCSKLDLDKQ